MDIKDSYLHGTVGVVKSISVSADKLTYNLADINNTAKTITLPLATTTANGLMSKDDKIAINSLGNYVTLNTDQEITGIKTFTKQLKFTVAKGTAPFLVTSNTKVDNLNVDLLDGHHSTSYLPYTIYNYEEGCLVKTDIPAKSSTMVTFIIEGNSYSGNTIFTTGEFYNYPTEDKILQCGAYHHGHNFGNITVFCYDGYVYIWFKLSRSFLSFVVTVYGTNNILNNINRVTSITNATLPTTGITRKVEIIPKISLNSTNYTSYIKESNFPGLNKIGTVTSVAIANGGGLSITGSPITTSGTVTITNTGVRSVTIGTGDNANKVAVNTGGTTTYLTIPYAIYSTHLIGGALGSIPYQSTADTTTFLAAPTTNGYVLKYNTTDKKPYWAADFDTKNTAGSTNSTSKLFLIGATSLETNPLTYSNSSVYTTNGALYATSFIGNLDGTYVNKLTNYTKATAIGSIATTDSLNTALGKLEFKTDFIYNDLFGTDNDDVINKWHEIVDFIDSVKEGTDILDEFVTRKTTLTISGVKTFSTLLNFTVALGTAPFTVTSTTKVSNLNSDLLDGYDSSLFLRAKDFITNPGLDANTLELNMMGFTYANNAPHYGTIIYFSGAAGGKYGLLLNSYYLGPGGLSFRSRNGDNNTWNNWSTILSLHNYTNYVNTTNFPGLNKTGTVTSVTVTGANGLSGTGTVTTSGIITLSNAGVRSTTINGNYLRVNTNGTDADLTIPYASNALTATYLNVQYCRDDSNPINAGLWNTIKNGTTNNISNRVRFYTVYGTTTDLGAPINGSGELLEICSYNNLGQPLLWFGSTKIGRLYYRNKNYNDNSWGAWRTVAWTSDIPTSLKNPNALTLQAGTFTAKTYDGSTEVTVNIPTHTSHLVNNSGFLTLHLSLANYVTLNTEQTITGVKTFSTNCLQVSGSRNYTTVLLSKNASIDAALRDNVWGIYHSNGSGVERGISIWSYGTGINNYVLSISAYNIGSTLDNPGSEVNSLYMHGIIRARSTITGSGFVKSSSSDSYVLLGGGGHKALSSITASKLNSITVVNAKEFSLSNASWTDTGYTFANLDTGTYAVQVTFGTTLVASGIMSVYKNLSDTAGDEIPLHVYGTAGWRPYLRTYANKLLISSNDTSATSRTVTIKIALIL